jgi:Tol biopolymer transport system component
VRAVALALVAASILVSPAGAGPSRIPGTIAFSGDGQIYVSRAGGAPARLTHDRVGAVGIAWSPDGSRLLAWHYKGVPAIAVFRADGSLVRTVATGVDGQPSWSPNGRLIAFQRYVRRGAPSRAIFVVDADGGNVHQVARYAQPYGRLAWSPDSAHLLYAGTDRRGHALFVVRADGADLASPRRLVAAGETNLAEASWSPDGKRLAFVHGRNVAIANADGTGVADVDVPFVFGPVWSPDGSSLAFVGRHVNWVVRADGSGLHRLPGCECRRVWPGFTQQLAWSPDSKDLAYSGGTGPGDQPLAGIYVERVDGGGATRIANTQSRQFSRPLWRP